MVLLNLALESLGISFITKRRKKRFDKSWGSQPFVTNTRIVFWLGTWKTSSNRVVKTVQSTWSTHTPTARTLRLQPIQLPQLYLQAYWMETLFGSRLRGEYSTEWVHMDRILWAILVYFLNKNIKKIETKPHKLQCFILLYKYLLGVFVILDLL